MVSPSSRVTTRRIRVKGSPGRVTSPQNRKRPSGCLSRLSGDLSTATHQAGSMYGRFRSTCSSKYRVVFISHHADSGAISSRDLMSTERPLARAGNRGHEQAYPLDEPLASSEFESSRLGRDLSGIAAIVFSLPASVLPSPPTLTSCHVLSGPFRRSRPPIPSESVRAGRWNGGSRSRRPPKHLQGRTSPLTKSHGQPNIGSPLRSGYRSTRRSSHSAPDPPNEDHQLQAPPRRLDRSDRRLRGRARESGARSPSRVRPGGVTRANQHRPCPPMYPHTGVSLGGASEAGCR